MSQMSSSRKRSSPPPCFVFVLNIFYFHIFVVVVGQKLQNLFRGTINHSKYFRWNSLTEIQCHHPFGKFKILLCHIFSVIIEPSGKYLIILQHNQKQFNLPFCSTNFLCNIIHSVRVLDTTREHSLTSKGDLTKLVNLFVIQHKQSS